MKYFIAGAATTISILIGVSLFNYQIDPMCFYHCNTIDITKPTMNTYYNVAQKIVAHPQSEIVLFGSSRGQTTPLKWIENRTGLKTLNLSLGGAEIEAKLEFLNIALERLKIKKVIWFADYFELSPDIIDSKVINTPVLRSYLEGDQKRSALLVLRDTVKSLIDHNTFEASLFILHKGTTSQLDQGSGSGLDPELCDSKAYKGEKTHQAMEKEVAFSFEVYARKVLKAKQSPDAWNAFVKKLNYLSEKGIDVSIVITPYNPEFIERMKKEEAATYATQFKWIEKLEALKIPHVRVFNFFSGIPNDDKTQRFWNDGVHFTCKGSIEMLKRVIPLR
jgi:hypothetical protein